MKKNKLYIISIVVVIVGLLVTTILIEKYKEEELKNTTRYTVDSKDTVVIGKMLPRSVKVFKDVSDLKKELGNKTVYIKHKIENSIVTESYVCIEKNDKTYCLSGGQINDTFVNYHKMDDEGKKKFKKNKELASLAYDSNKKSLEDIFDGYNCEEETGYYKTKECKDETLDILISDWGDVEVTYNQEEQCIVRSVGISGCYKKEKKGYVIS